MVFMFRTIALSVPTQSLRPDLQNQCRISNPKRDRVGPPSAIPLPRGHRRGGRFAGYIL